MEESEESNSNYISCKTFINPKKKICKVKYIKKKSDNKKMKSKRNLTQAIRSN